MRNARRAKERADPVAPGFRSEFYPFTHVSRTSGRYNQALTAALRTIGLEQPEWRLLMVLSEYNPSCVSELVERTVVRQSTLTRIVQRMVRDGLARTAPRAGDQRVVDVYLTAKGRRLARKSRPIASRVYRRAVAALSDRELAELVRLLIVVERSLGARLD